MIPVRENYDAVFRAELSAYTSGLENYPGEVFPELVFRFVRELEESFVRAIEQHVAFDVIALSKQIARAGKYLVHEKDIAFCILSVLPPPTKFTEDAQFVLGQIVDQVEQTYGGALDRLAKKWRWELKFEAEQRG
ncbi:MAG: hypothetical protein EBZ48_03515 [Proteobacteria bacterium]|nr:hypothetical protein [Pseudomonadota bacterium]